jgi:hypothetical protein
VGKRTNYQIGKVAVIPILIGWLITIFVAAAITGIILVVLSNEVQTKEGIYGYKCYGFFKSCDLDVCMDVSSSTALGLAPLQPLNQFKYCDVNSEAKIETKACIYDQDLYTQSESILGFDICSESFAGGSYIFEDTFEQWGNTSLSSNKMKSARWGHIVNGYATNYCGVGQFTGGRKSLSFSGYVSRYAETTDMDVETGGWIEAELLIPPVRYCTLTRTEIMQ